ncbi:Thioredoxin domain containing protein [Asbolus verrucosus]|uniref:protein disulfide-isomerase n=1 Tax=Asbolus verrucosus TaxID=1661398 RepID=A0A482W8R7_ASBVE|nr:Thioredoxin domain containing protein [Asbolus verrucosus]
MRPNKLVVLLFLSCTCLAKERKRDNHLELEALYKFIVGFLNSKIEPNVVDSKRARATGGGHVAVAALNNFEDVVTNNGKDTLVEFFAPWCPYCKELAPVYEELGEKLRDEDVAIVKMDGTGEVPSNYAVRQYPTLYWVPKDSKSSPVRYEGGRELNDFVKYIAEHATSELKGYDRKGNPK